LSDKERDSNTAAGGSLPYGTIATNIMGKPKARYVCKAIPGVGWRIWNRKTRKWWGNPFRDFPSELLEELNGPKRPEKLCELCKRK
jgi:hypothetical protein